MDAAGPASSHVRRSWPAEYDLAAGRALLGNRNPLLSIHSLSWASVSLPSLSECWPCLPICIQHGLKSMQQDRLGNDKLAHSTAQHSIVCDQGGSIASSGIHHGGAGGSVANKEPEAQQSQPAEQCYMLNAQCITARQTRRGIAVVHNKWHAHCYDTPAPTQHCRCKVSISRNTSAQDSSPAQHRG